LSNGCQIPICGLSHFVVEEDRMTPEERRLIEDLFDRMMSYGAPDKDREAEALINQRVRAMPEAVYMLTQSVLVQEQALQASNERIAELEERLRALEEGGGQPRRSGGFLSGGFLGRNRDPEPRPSSVPQAGTRPAPSGYDRPSAWGQGAPAQPPPPPPAAAGGGGGFMRSAIATAAGVAGGVLAADSIRNMLGGHAKAGEASGRDEHKQQAYQDTSSSDQSEHEQSNRDQSDSDQSDYDTAEDDNFDNGGDFSDDSIDV
jgi:uncharacterized protein